MPKQIFTTSNSKHILGALQKTTGYIFSATSKKRLGPVCLNSACLSYQRFTLLCIYTCILYIYIITMIFYYNDANCLWYYYSIHIYVYLYITNLLISMTLLWTIVFSWVSLLGYLSNSGLPNFDFFQRLMVMLEGGTTSTQGRRWRQSEKWVRVSQTAPVVQLWVII